MSGWLEGHVAVMVGGGSGIGNAVVEAFLAEGAEVAVLEHDEGKCVQLAKGHPDVLVVQGDARSPADNRRLVSEALTAFGAVNSATSFVGVFDHRVPLRSLPEDGIATAFEEIFSTNVRSTLELAAAVAGPLAAHRGSLLLTLSNAAFYPGGGGVLYTASKFALRGVVAQLAHELAPDVRVNGVAPGGTLETDLRGVSSLGSAELRSADRPGRSESLRAATPLQVAATAADHAAAYVYLASARSRVVTGAVTNSDGGVGVRG